MNLDYEAPEYSNGRVVLKRKNKMMEYIHQPGSYDILTIEYGKLKGACWFVRYYGVMTCSDEIDAYNEFCKILLEPERGLDQVVDGNKTILREDREEIRRETR